MSGEVERSGAERGGADWGNGVKEEGKTGKAG